MEVNVSSIPLFDNVLKMAAEKMTLPLGISNAESFGQQIRFEDKVPEEVKSALFDPQTSGGLLIAVPESRKEVLLQKLHENGVTSACIIGNVTDGKGGRIYVSM
jgi:selenide,water dikinase